ncbi:carbohydrate esterase family 5 protein [Pleomassaria siparia CBS 279.74]|uniref:Cutinase n=1 Tax=Pleomassaria siparia CBS 279.74 TaxID=1314801 RepID=A0A6G1KI99_9PLEO|nr:carbohydrate esterase family 5 protein [Pleomassaria siparia CBS 279.74]
MYTKSFIAALLFGLANSAAIEQRQTRTTSKEFSEGGCADILFAFARGSTEIGNMVHIPFLPLNLPICQLTCHQGTIAGPPTSDGLKKTFGANNVATEGIDYAAALAPNVLAGGTDVESKLSMQNTLLDMAAQCPDSIIVAGGYSQGAAVSHRAIEDLDPAVQDQIAGVILYGDTQKQQDNDQIPNFPVDKIMIICQPGDLVCLGTLTILPAHLTYGQRADEGAAFLASQIQSAQVANKARKAKRDAEEIARLAEADMKKVKKNFIV